MKLKLLPGEPGKPIGTESKEELLVSSGGPRWKTKDGEILSIKDMSDEHLKNATDMVAKRRVNLKAILKSVNATYGTLMVETQRRATLVAQAESRRRRDEYMAIKAAEAVAKLKPKPTGRKFREN